MGARLKPMYRGGGALIPLADNNTIGRSDMSSLVLPFDAISRHHALLTKKNGRFVVIDQNSTNGTFVNGHKINTQVLNNGDQVAFGGYSFEFLEQPGPDAIFDESAADDACFDIAYV